MTVTIRSGQDVQTGSTTPCPSLNWYVSRGDFGELACASSASILLDGRQGLGVGLAYIDDSPVADPSAELDAGLCRHPGLSPLT